jgi:hypothetical protein
MVTLKNSRETHTKEFLFLKNYASKLPYFKQLVPTSCQNIAGFFKNKLALSTKAKILLCLDSL